jgi:hypothetical protein
MKKKKRKIMKKAKKGKSRATLIPKKIEGKLHKFVASSEDKYFVLKNGKKLKSLFDLAKGLEKMSDDVFSHHVTPYKNDFSAWIYHVFSEVELARMLANEKNKKQTIIIIKEYFKK